MPYISVNSHDTMSVLRAISGAAIFVVAGLVAIIVGAFMLRGNMRMWDRRDRKK